MTLPMSPLQLSLIVAGVLLVVGVIIYNWWVVRQARQRMHEIDAQPDVDAGLATQRVLVGAGAFRVDHRQARIAPPLVEIRVVRDRQHPHQQVSTLVELMPVGERTFQGCLHQIIGRRRVEHQRARIAAQARDHPEQLLAEDVVGLH
jgi:hypothetical protein